MYTYGYETISNQNISAGAQPITGMDNPLSGDDFEVTIHNGKLEITTSAMIDRLELTDLNGKIIRKNIPQGLSIDIAGLPRQVYFLTVYDNKTAKQITIKKMLLGD